MPTEIIGATSVGHQAERRDDPEPKTMRALRLVAPRRVGVQEAEPPQPGPRQVRVRAHGCGICGSDLSLSRRPFALDSARRCGARETGLVDNPEEVAALVMQLTGGTGCDRVIEAAGAQAALDLASALIATRGRLVIVSYHQDSHRVVNVRLWNWRGIDVINARERDPAVRAGGISQAKRMLASGVIDPACLYTDLFTLDRAAEGFTPLETRPEGFLKGWIRTHDEIP